MTNPQFRDHRNGKFGAEEKSMGTLERNKAVVGRYFADIISGGPAAAAAIDEIIAADCVFHDMPGGDMTGAEAFKQAMRGAPVTFPDMRAEVHDLVAEGDKVVARFTVSATHAGELMGVPASGKRLTWNGINAFRVVDGRIVEEWISEDFLGMLQQAGAIPAPGRAG
jgi:steroid delta-isomerase-like uncharacterized protein